MAKRPATDSGLPRREPGKALDAASEGVTHPHGDTEHLHRMGLIAHDHDDDGHVQFHTDTRFTPAVPVVSPLEEFTGDEGTTSVPATEGNAGGSGRPTIPTPPAIVKAAKDYDDTTAKVAATFRAPGRSIGTVIANTGFDAALGVPPDVQDEQAHAREATELLIVAAAEHYSHDELMPASMLLDLEGVVLHMVKARGLRGGS